MFASMRYDWAARSPARPRGMMRNFRGRTGSEKSVVENIGTDDDPTVAFATDPASLFRGEAPPGGDLGAGGAISTEGRDDPKSGLASPNHTASRLYRSRFLRVN